MYNSRHEKLSKMSNRSGTLLKYAIMPNLEDLFHYDFEYVLGAYVVIPVSIIVLLCNSILLFLFWKMRSRNSVHILVASISISETLFVLTQSSFAYVIHIFNLRKFIPYKHCSVFVLLFNILPEIFRCHSIFLTMALATQRCVCVTHPFKISIIFTRRRTVLVVVCLFLLSVLFKFYDLIVLENRERHHFLKGRFNNSAPTSISICMIVPRGWTVDFFETLFLVQTILRISCVNVIPSIWLIVTRLILMCGLKKASKWRKDASVLKTNQQLAQDAKERQLTILTIWIIGIFLFFQTPFCIIDSITFYPQLIPKDKIRTLLTARTLAQFCLNLTLTSNFIIYMFCYKEYYEYSKSIFVCKRSAAELNQPIHEQNSGLALVEPRVIPDTTLLKL